MHNACKRKLFSFGLFAKRGRSRVECVSSEHERKVRSIRFDLMANVR